VSVERATSYFSLVPNNTFDDDRDRADELGLGAVLQDEDLTCSFCGEPLTGDLDDQPDWPSGPMCANCYQAREMDNDLWAMELNSEEDL